MSEMPKRPPSALKDFRIFPTFAAQTGPDVRMRCPWCEDTLHKSIELERFETIEGVLSKAMEHLLSEHLERLAVDAGLSGVVSVVDDS